MNQKGSPEGGPEKDNKSIENGSQNERFLESKNIQNHCKTMAFKVFAFRNKLPKLAQMDPKTDPKSIQNRPQVGPGAANGRLFDLFGPILEGPKFG